MYKETIKYTDCNDVEREEDFYFNLNKAELIEMEMGTTGSMSQILDKIVRAKDTPDIIEQIKKLLLKSYGVKSPDGRFFMKTDEIRQQFECSEPFSIMFMKLSTDDEAAAKFITGIMPKDVVDQLPADVLGSNRPALAPIT